MPNTVFNQRALIRISALDESENARDFLQGLVTQDLDAVQHDAPQWGALLSPQGKCLFDFILWAAKGEFGDDILIDCERDAAGDLVRKLTLYRLRRKLSIEREEILCVHWALDAADKIKDPRLDALGYRWLAPFVSGDNGIDDAFRDHRLSLGVCEGMDELGSDKILWLECNAIELNGVSFDKGCYIGQENTARMHYRNKVNRRIVCVPIEHANAKRQITVVDNLSIEHRRIDGLADAIIPDWLALETTEA